MTDRLQPILLLAAFKIAIAALISILVLLRPSSSDVHTLVPIILLGQLVALGGSGVLLIARGRWDPGGMLLGTICLLLAAAFTPSDTLGLHRHYVDLRANLLFLLANLRVELYLVPLLGVFVRKIPAASLSFPFQNWLERFIRISWRLVGGLLIVHLATLAALSFGKPAEALSDPSHEPILVSLVGLLLCSLALLAKRARGAVQPATELSRRSRLFVLILAVGTLSALAVFMVLLDPSRSFNVPSRALIAVILAVHTVLAVGVLALAYGAFARRMTLSAVPRKVLQPKVVQRAVEVVLGIPFVAVGIYLAQHRESRLAELFTTEHLPIGVVTALGVLGLCFRRRLLDALERRVFPEHYQAHRILAQLPEQMRGARDLKQLANLISRGVALAWQLDRAGLLVVIPDRGELVDPNRELPPITRDAKIVQWVEKTRRPLIIDLETRSTAVHRLPESELHWLVDCRIRILAPAFAMDGDLNALIALGSKRDEQPFLSDDRQLLIELGAGAGLVIELLELKRREPAGLGRENSGTYGMSEEILTSNSRAAECLSCGRVYPAGTPLCRKCDIELAEALVPYALRRMFRFEERIGVGGMAIVYRATDLNLGRSVAIKTLPRVGPEAAVRLQREARTAATVSHPGLAAIYGIETWEGTPMLILELLEGGTLTDRMMEGPVDPQTVIETGMVVAQALEVIHNLGILHRDIKPSNIGFTRHGAAKLLDFGIARIYEDLRDDNEDPSEVLTLDGSSEQAFEAATGTLCYFSPEALDEEQPDPTFDLWSLNVVLFEALTARNLFYTPRLKDMVDAIREARLPNLREHVPDCPPQLEEYFRTELNPSKSVRSQTGKALYERLEEIRQALGHAPAEPKPVVTRIS